MKEILLKLQALQLVAFEKGIVFDIDIYFNSVFSKGTHIEVWSRDEFDRLNNVSFSTNRKNEWKKNLKIAETWTM